MNNIRIILQDRFPNNQNTAQHFENLLTEYESLGHAPPNMIAEWTTRDSGKDWSHGWEVVLYRHINSLGFTFIDGRVKKIEQEGPDFGINFFGKKIWIEAIVPAPIGIPLEYLQPPSVDAEKVEAMAVPHDQKLVS